MSSSGPANSSQSSRMGQYNLLKLDSNGIPIYANTEKDYLYVAPSNGLWTVRKDY